MGKGKFHFPTAKEFLKKKRMNDKKKDPVWVYLEREMVENQAKKPYNNKVGAWLKFLKDLRYYFFYEAKRKYNRLHKEAGPPWYLELSIKQSQVAFQLKADIHKDKMQKNTKRIEADLYKLGVNAKFDKCTLLKCMNSSLEDPGLFLWYLYESRYKVSPVELRLFYDLDAMIIMSCLVLLDYEECFRLLKIFINTVMPPKPPPPPPKETPKYYQPDVKYGVYLQKMYVPLVGSEDSSTEQEHVVPEIQIKLRTPETYEEQRIDLSFIQRRKNDQIKAESAAAPRVCNYKFWKCPDWVRSSDPNGCTDVMKNAAWNSRARRSHLDKKVPFQWSKQFQLGAVTYAGSRARFVINNISTLSSPENILINNGLVAFQDEYISCVGGHVRIYEQSGQYQCDEQCNCLAAWGDRIEDHVKNTKCKCYHYFDDLTEDSNEDELSKKSEYFHPPTKYSEAWLDEAKVFQLDKIPDFIKLAVEHAVKSESTINTDLCFSAKGLKMSTILEAFFYEISNTSLIMPHLPKVNQLNSLKAWLKLQVHGKLTTRDHKRLALRTQRRLAELSNVDFKLKAYYIPFTQKEKDNFNWSHRPILNDLFHTLLEDFKLRNSRKLVEQTRMFWPPMFYHFYPNKAFRDVFFTYMPGSIRDVYMIKPYDPQAPRRPLPTSHNRDWS